MNSQGKHVNGTRDAIDTDVSSRMPDNRNATVSSSKLQEEFRTFVEKLGVQHLELVWRPDLRKEVSGEVRNGILYIYEEDENKAIETVKHELIDYLITSRLIKPLVDMINLLMKSKESDIYREKEKIVEGLIKMLL